MIELRGVCHDYVTDQGRTISTTHAVDGVDLTIPKLQFVSIVGPSGCGKTTLLRLIAGLLEPTEGELLIHGEPLVGPGPDRAVVFQESALYPWRTVRKNILLGLELMGRDGPGVEEAVNRQLELMHLSEFADAYPAALSGGMQQRVALARALVVEPSILLMDEPFGSLDAITRKRLGEELLQIWERDQRTVIFVTHSIDEALLLSDRVLVMRGGVILRDVAVDLPRPRDANGVFEDPAFVAVRRTLSELL